MTTSPTNEWDIAAAILIHKISAHGSNKYSSLGLLTKEDVQEKFLSKFKMYEVRDAIGYMVSKNYLEEYHMLECSSCGFVSELVVDTQKRDRCPQCGCTVLTQDASTLYAIPQFRLGPKDEIEDEKYLTRLLRWLIPWRKTKSL